MSYTLGGRSIQTDALIEFRIKEVPQEPDHCGFRIQVAIDSSDPRRNDPPVAGNLQFPAASAA